MTWYRIRLLWTVASIYVFYVYSQIFLQKNFSKWDLKLTSFHSNLYLISQIKPMWNYCIIWNIVEIYFILFWCDFAAFIIKLVCYKHFLLSQVRQLFRTQSNLFRPRFLLVSTEPYPTFSVLGFCLYLQNNIQPFPS